MSVPDGWIVSGDGDAGVQKNGLLSLPEGSQFGYLDDNSILTTADGVLAQRGIYDVTASVGNIQFGSAFQEPGMYVLRVGYGSGNGDFEELASEVLSGERIAEGQWEDLSVEASVSDTSPAVGQRLLVRVEHIAFESSRFNRRRGVVDNVRIEHSTPSAVLDLPNWPTGVGEALVSDKYRAWATQDGVRTELQVLMSESIDPTEPRNGSPTNTHGRTFSWVALSSNFAKDVTIEVEKIYGTGAPEVEILPSGYGIDHNLSGDGRTVTFDLDRSRYLSVNFKTEDNQKTDPSMIENMMAIFADPLERDQPDPNAPGTVVLTNDSTLADLQSASTIYIPQGFYDFRQMFGQSSLDLYSGQSVYTEPGAFMLGYIGTVDGQAHDMRVYGRGAFSGRNEVWKTDPHDLIRLNGRGNIVEGVFAFDGNNHGVVSGTEAAVNRVKMWGWHYNNDGFRNWSGTVHNSFLRPVDDAFYIGGAPMSVTDTVIMQGLNGGVATYGWGDADQFAFVMKDSHIINPEWVNLHVNNGILMTQTSAKATLEDVRFENIIIDGDIPGLTNIKLGDAFGTDVPPEEIGSLSGLTFRNIKVNGEFRQLNFGRDTSFESKSLLQGTALNNGADTYWVHDVLFENVSVGGVYLTETNKDQFFDVDPNTTFNISFSAAQQPFDGIPHRVRDGSRLELERYDLGGEGVAFHDSTTETFGNPIRQDFVDGGSTPGSSGERIGWNNNGEWLEFTVDTTSGLYDIDLRYSSGAASAGDVRLLIGDGPNGENFTELGIFDLVPTGGWTQWNIATLPRITLPEGQFVLRAENVGHGFDLDALDFRLSSTTPPVSVDLNVSTNSATETEQTLITVTAAASSPVSGDQTVEVAVSGTNISANDYSLTSSVITIPDGQTTGSVSLSILDDAIVEAITETLQVTLLNPSSGLLLSSAQRAISITDNDFLAPTITGPAGPAVTGPFDVVVDFGDLVTGFDANDLLVTEGTVTEVVSEGNGIFAVSINPTGGGTVTTVSIPSGAALDRGGKSTLASVASYSVTVNTATPIASGIDVQHGQQQRSYINSVDILFNDSSGLADLLSRGGIRVERFGTHASNVTPGTGSAITNFGATVSGNSVRLNFGSNGLGGNGSAGNGFYRILLDLDGDGDFTDDGMFEFFRLYGDANGDGLVNNVDTQISADLNGDGVINNSDRKVARRQRGKSISSSLLSLIDD